MIKKMIKILTTSLLVVLIAYIVFPLSINFDSEDLNGRVALVTGGSRGSGRGFVHGLLEARATVYVTGRTRGSLEETCRTSKRPDLCKIRVLDNSKDQELEDLFRDIMEIEGRLDVLVNNAYSALGYWRRRELLGTPFWETDVELYDAVHDVGVRSHYRASVLAVRIMRNQARGGVIVNTNSPGCLLYSMNVPYGMGKCAIDKMSADMSVELDFDSSDVTVVSWWPKSPMQTEEIRTFSFDFSSILFRKLTRCIYFRYRNSR